MTARPMTVLRKAPMKAVLSAKAMQATEPGLQAAPLLMRAGWNQLTAMSSYPADRAPAFQRPMLPAST